jgi:hypothetical protein
MQVSVKVDVDRALKALDAIPRNVDRAAATALNRVGTTAHAVAAREISQVTGLKVSEVKRYVPLAKADRNTLTATLSAKPWAPNLIHFSARQTRRGVSANAWRKRKVYKGTFIANKGRTVFKRVGKLRLPIEPVHGPSVPREFVKQHTLDAIRKTVGERFPIEFERALKALAK